MKKHIAALVDAAPSVTPIRLVDLGDEFCSPARIVLKSAKAAKLDHCVVIGRDESGELWAESSVNAAHTLFLLERLRERVLKRGAWAVI